MKAYNYLQIELPQAPTLELADKLRKMRLTEREHQYAVFDAASSYTQKPQTGRTPRGPGR